MDMYKQVSVSFLLFASFGVIGCKSRIDPIQAPSQSKAVKFSSSDNSETDYYFASVIQRKPDGYCFYGKELPKSFATKNAHLDFFGKEIAVLQATDLLSKFVLTKADLTREIAEVMKSNPDISSTAKDAKRHADVATYTAAIFSNMSSSNSNESAGSAVVTQRKIEAADAGTAASNATFDEYANRVSPIADQAVVLNSDPFKNAQKVEEKKLILLAIQNVSNRAPSGDWSFCEPKEMVIATLNRSSPAAMAEKSGGDCGSLRSQCISMICRFVNAERGKCAKVPANATEIEKCVLNNQSQLKMKPQCIANP